MGVTPIFVKAAKFYKKADYDNIFFSEKIFALFLIILQILFI